MERLTALAPAETSEPTTLTSRPTPLIVLHPVIAVAAMMASEKESINFFIGHLDAKTEAFCLTRKNTKFFHVFVALKSKTG